MRQSDAIFRLEKVEYTWPGAASFGLRIDDFTLGRGERLLLLGESGSGKSTLLSLLCGTVAPQSGSILIDDTDLAALSTAARDRFRAENIGIVFQQFNLLPFASVSDNILLPLRFAPSRRTRVTDPGAEVQRLCTQLGLPAASETARAGTLSVGQQQRVAVARALIGAPPLLVADEPTSALDMSTQGAFLDLLFAQADAQETSVLMVSHDPRLADRFDRTVQMADIAQVLA